MWRWQGGDMTLPAATLVRLAREAEVEQMCAETPALRRAFAQLSAAYTMQALRQSACAAAQPLAQAHWKL
ncbi:hypothetical protein DM480_11950 [Sphingomonas sp. FARSPH]|jgi:hypothetical protein|nr:hypothetical protein DM480_11950 [Sphingomonas sp. FARSPH]